MDIVGELSETESVSLCEHIRINLKEVEDTNPEYYESLEIYCKECDITHNVEMFVN